MEHFWRILACITFCNGRLAVWVRAQAIARQAGLTLSPAALQPESREVANNVVATGGSSRAASPLAAIRDCGAAAAAAERFLARQATSGTLAAVTARGELAAPCSYVMTGALRCNA